jgi:hypothetical protein
MTQGQSGAAWPDEVVAVRIPIVVCLPVPGADAGRISAAGSFWLGGAHTDAILTLETPGANQARPSRGSADDHRAATVSCACPPIVADEPRAGPPLRIGG